MTVRRQTALVIMFCGLAFLAHAAFSVHVRSVLSEWGNVPPVPTAEAAAVMALGDRQFAYRFFGTIIQNFGDAGGRSIALYKYDYDRLGQWFYLQDEMDPLSNYMPFMAAYYFSATQEAEDLDPVIEYLADVGRRADDNKWRWLAHAAYLARFRQEDFGKAMMLAQELAALDVPDMPIWAAQMPAFISAAQGDTETAYTMMMGLLREKSDELHPNEVNFLVHYICDRLLDESAAAQHPLCQSDQ